MKYLFEKMGLPDIRIFNRFDPANPVEIELSLGADWANSNFMP
jgi:hypothetical protein